MISINFKQITGFVQFLNRLWSMDYKLSKLKGVLRDFFRAKEAIVKYSVFDNYLNGPFLKVALDFISSDTRSSIFLTAIERLTTAKDCAMLICSKYLFAR